MKKRLIITLLFILPTCLTISCGNASQKTEPEIVSQNSLPDDFIYLPEMYDDSYFPNKLVDKIKVIIQKTGNYLDQNELSPEDIQEELDKMTCQINNLQEDFHQRGSEIETVARESIANTVEHMLAYYDIDIDTEEALRMRDW